MTIGGAVKSQKMLNKMYESGFTAKAVLNYTGSGTTPTSPNS